MLKTWNISACATRDHWLVRTIYKFPDMLSVGSLHWRYPLINEVYRWCHECDPVTFSKILFGVQPLTWSVNLHTNFKGITKLYFMYYWPVVFDFFSTGLYKSAFCTYFSVFSVFSVCSVFLSLIFDVISKNLTTFV